MIALKEWFDKNAKRPVAMALGVALSLQVAYLGYLSYNNFTEALARIDRIRETVSLGVQQANRPLIESTLISGLQTVQASAAALCEGDRASLVYPPTRTAPCTSRSLSIFRWVVRRDVIGMSGQQIVFVLRPLNIFGPFFVFITITIFSLFPILWILLRARVRFQEEVLGPLSHGLHEETALKIAELDELRRQNREHHALVRRQAVSEALVELSTQVAHDVRSPLEALGEIADDGEALPEGDRAVMRDSVRRLREINNGLLERSRLLPCKSGGSELSEGAGVFPVEPESVQSLDTLIGPVVSEKRLGHRERDGVLIEHILNSASCVLFGKVQATEFRRVISNLLSNGIEAVDGDGSVTVGVLQLGEKIQIKIQDTGRGIAPELLGRLGRRGETYGKPGGSGLGLYHAKLCVERWGGNLDISSVAGEGTTVMLSLPWAAAPPWAISEVPVRLGAPVVVVDDDPGIHKVWRRRFDSCEVLSVELLHFATPKEMRDWVRVNPAMAREAIFLVDYQFVGYAESGLELIESLGLHERAVLVTGRFDEERILEGCLRLTVRMLPKVLAAHIPISSRSNSQSPVESGRRKSPAGLSASPSYAA